MAGADSCRRASAVALRCGQAGAGSPAPASLPARRWVSAGPSALAASGRGVARSLTARVRLSPGGSSPPPHPLSRGSLTGASIRSPPPPGTHTPPLKLPRSHEKRWPRGRRCPGARVGWFLSGVSVEARRREGWLPGSAGGGGWAGLRRVPPAPLPVASPSAPRAGAGGPPSSGGGGLKDEDFL